MMVIHFSSDTPELEEVLNLLQANSFAFRKERIPELKSLRLIEGKTIYEGYEAVLGHVRKLVRETDQWWYCQCNDQWQD